MSRRHACPIDDLITRGRAAGGVWFVDTKANKLWLQPTTAPIPQELLDEIGANVDGVMTHLELELLDHAMGAFADALPACSACRQQAWTWDEVGQRYVCGRCHPAPEVAP